MDAQHDDAFLVRLIDDFPFFVEQVWLDRGLDSYAPIGWVERDILHWVQHGPAKQGVLAPRGFGKTHLITAAVTCWDLLRDPDHKTLIVSKSESEAVKTVSLIRSWLDYVPFLTHLSPSHAHGRDLRDTTKYFDAAGSREDRTPSVVAKGIDGQVTGTRAHRVIADDVETPANSLTVEARRELAEKVNEFTAIATYGDRRINYVGTFHHEESLYLTEGKKGVAFRSWPELYPQPDEKVYCLAPAIRKRIEDGSARSGAIVADYRIDPAFVAERQARGRTWYAMQAMLVADLGDTLRYPLRLSDLIVFPISRDQAPTRIAWGQANDRATSTRIQDIPSLGFGDDGFFAPIMYDATWATYTGTKMWIDPAGRGADKTGYAVVSHLNGFLWVKTVGGLPGGYEPNTLNQLAQIAFEHRARDIYVEDNFGQGMLAPLLEPVLKQYFRQPGDQACKEGWAARVQTVRTTGQKEIRILEALEPVVSSHRMILDRKTAENKDLQYQFTRITRQRDCLPHEDELESLAMCCMLWQRELNQDPQASAQRHDQQQIRKVLREHLKLAGITPHEPRYFQHR